MKKYLVLFCIVILLITASCGKKLDTYTKINYVEYLEKMDNKATFPLVIGSETCSACGLFEGTMKEFITKYQVEVFFIDLSKLSEEEYNSLKSDVNFDGTPTTIFIESGKLTSFYNRIDGTTSLSNVETIFKKNKYID